MARPVQTRSHVAKNVETLRRADGLSQGALAARVTEAGVPMTLKTISRIELGTRGIDVDDLTALAIALGTSESYLLSDPVERQEQEGQALLDSWIHGLQMQQEATAAWDRQIEVRWGQMCEYAAQTPERRAAMEVVLARADRGEELVAKLAEGIEAASWRA